MRIFPIVAAILVAALIYYAIVDRQSLMAFLGRDAAEQNNATAQETTSAEGEDVATSGLVKVVVQKSNARAIDTAVSLRGETNAARTVDVRAETSAIVVSDPLRKGARVEQGQLLCRLDEGTRATALAQALAPGL